VGLKVMKKQNSASAPHMLDTMTGGRDHPRQQAAAHCRQRIHNLACNEKNPDALRAEIMGELRKVIGFGAWCWLLSDPVSQCRAGAFLEADLGFLRDIPRLVNLDETDPYSVKPRLAKVPWRAAALSAATGGDLPRSRSWDEVLRPNGHSDELAIRCHDQYGYWGWLLLWRDRRNYPFTAAECALAAAIAPDLATATRRLWTGPHRPGPLPPPGVVMIDRDFQVRSWNASAEQWLPLLARPAGSMQPIQLQVAAAHAAAAAGTGTSAAPVLTTRFRTASGACAILDASPLSGDAAGQVAVTVRAMSREEECDLRSRALMLTAREREVAYGVASCMTNPEIAACLKIRNDTVKRHVEAIFSKAGVRTRSELTRSLTGDAPSEEEPRRSTRRDPAQAWWPSATNLAATERRP
jgi:DNA-binding CsgD family transcriptional regulator